MISCTCITQVEVGSDKCQVNSESVTAEQAESFEALLSKQSSNDKEETKIQPKAEQPEDDELNSAASELIAPIFWLGEQPVVVLADAKQAVQQMEQSNLEIVDSGEGYGFSVEQVQQQLSMQTELDFNSQVEAADCSETDTELFASNTISTSFVLNAASSEEGHIPDSLLDGAEMNTKSMISNFGAGEVQNEMQSINNLTELKDGQSLQTNDNNLNLKGLNSKGEDLSSKGEGLISKGEKTAELKETFGTTDTGNRGQEKNMKHSAQESSFSSTIRTADYFAANGSKVIAADSINPAVEESSPQAVIQQLSSKISYGKLSEGSFLKVNLQPAELGKMSICIEKEAETCVAKIYIEEETVKHMLSDKLDELMTVFSQKMIKVDQVILTSELTDQNTTGNSFFQDQHQNMSGQSYQQQQETKVQLGQDERLYEGEQRTSQLYGHNLNIYV